MSTNLNWPNRIGKMSGHSHDCGAFQRYRKIECVKVRNKARILSALLDRKMRDVISDFDLFSTRGGSLTYEQEEIKELIQKDPNDMTAKANKEWLEMSDEDRLSLMRASALCIIRSLKTILQMGNTPEKFMENLDKWSPLEEFPCDENQ